MVNFPRPHAPLPPAARQESLAGMLVAVTWTQVAMATAFVGARLWARKIVLNNLGLDDLLITLNLLCFVLYAVFVIFGARHGLGREFNVVYWNHYVEATWWTVMAQAFIFACIATSKASVIWLLLRIARARWQRWILWFCLATITLFSAAMLVLVFVQCQPWGWFWHAILLVVDEACTINLKPPLYAFGAYSAFLDFVLAALPWAMIFNLNMRKKEKYTVAIGLSMGFIAGIFASVRTWEMRLWSHQPEYLYDITSGFLWCSSEILVTTFCGCLPTYRPLINKARRHFGTSDLSPPRTYFNHIFSKWARKTNRNKRSSITELEMGVIHPNRDSNSVQLSRIFSGNLASDIRTRTRVTAGGGGLWCDDDVAEGFGLDDRTLLEWFEKKARFRALSRTQPETWAAFGTIVVQTEFNIEEHQLGSDEQVDASYTALAEGGEWPRTVDSASIDSDDEDQMLTGTSGSIDIPIPDIAESPDIVGSSDSSVDITDTPGSHGPGIGRTSLTLNISFTAGSLDRDFERNMRRTSPF